MSHQATRQRIARVEVVACARLKLVWTLVADPILIAILAATFRHGSGGAAAIYAGLHEAWLVLRSALRGFDHVHTLRERELAACA